jgi:hypothetical protein
VRPKLSWSFQHILLQTLTTGLFGSFLPNGWRSDNLPPKGSSNSDGGLEASSSFRYTIAHGLPRVLTYFTCFSRRFALTTRLFLPFLPNGWRSDNLPPKGSSNSDGGLEASSTFRYTIADGVPRVLTYFTCFSRRPDGRSHDPITQGA